MDELRPVLPVGEVLVGVSKCGLCDGESELMVDVNR